MLTHRSRGNESTIDFFVAGSVWTNMMVSARVVPPMSVLLPNWVCCCAERPERESEPRSRKLHGRDVHGPLGTELPLGSVGGKGCASTPRPWRARYQIAPANAPSPAMSANDAETAISVRTNR